MKEQEEANRIIELYYNTEYCPKNHFPNNRYCDCGDSMNLYQAKQCALIHVDGLIYFCEQMELYTSVDYWQKVKEIIQKS